MNPPDEQTPLPGGEQLTHRRRRQEATPSPVSSRRPATLPGDGDIPLARRAPSPPARVYRMRTGIARWPFAMRAALGALIAIVLAVSGVTITRYYLDVQAQRRQAQEEAALKARHPLYYREAIETAAAENNLNPALLCAVILCESSFDPQAESRLGARGLMQLMEPTAQWVADKLDVADYTFDMMYDAQTNIRFGAWYLGYLARRWADGDALKVICAYHAGQGNVDAWLKNPLYSQDGLTLTTIPTEDTAKYAKRVLSAYAVYQKYYFTSETDENDPDTFDDAFAGAAA